MGNASSRQHPQSDAPRSRIGRRALLVGGAVTEPMLVLMVAYTMVSLWIIAQPIVETGGGG